MGIDDYFSEYSRRDFLKTIGVGALVACGLSSYARASEKTRALSEDDKNLLIDNKIWRDDEPLRKEYNSLAVKYMEVLNEKGKYNPEKKEALKKSIRELVAKAKTRKEKLEILKKELMIYERPDEYIKDFVSRDESYVIKQVRHGNSIEPYERYTRYLDADPLNLDLSDKIKLYQFAKARKPTPQEEKLGRDMGETLGRMFLEFLQKK